MINDELNDSTQTDHRRCFPRIIRHLIVLEDILWLFLTVTAVALPSLAEVRI